MKSFRDMFQLWLKAFRLGLCTVGPIFLLVSAALALRTEYFLHHRSSTTGVIVNNVPIQSRDETANAFSTTFAPVFTFAAQDGKTYMVTSSASSNPPEYAVGQQVRVLYLPGNPASARLDSYWQLWGFETGFAIGGAACVLAGYGWLLFLRSRRPRQLAPVN